MSDFSFEHKARFVTAQTKLDRSLIFGLNLKVDVDEFLCPALDPDRVHSWHTLLVCEGKGRGRGCNDLANCKAYNEQKALQIKFPELAWDNPSVINEKMRTRLNMIKKGAILNP